MSRRFAAEHCAGLELDTTHLLGTSGTVTTIAGVHLRLRRYDRRQVDGCWMTDGAGADACSMSCAR